MSESALWDEKRSAAEKAAEICTINERLAAETEAKKNKAKFAAMESQRKYDSPEEVARRRKVDDANKGMYLAYQKKAQIEKKKKLDAFTPDQGSNPLSKVIAAQGQLLIVGGAILFGGAFVLKKIVGV